MGLTRGWEILQRGGQERRVSGVGAVLREVGVEKSFHPEDAEDGIVVVLDVAAKLVLVPGEVLGVACRGEVDDLGDDRDAFIAALDGEACGLEGQLVFMMGVCE